MNDEISCRKARWNWPVVFRCPFRTLISSAMHQTRCVWLISGCPFGTKKCRSRREEALTHFRFQFETRHLVSYKSRAHDEAASGAPERFAFRQRANVAQAFGHDAAGGGRNINANHGDQVSAFFGNWNSIGNFAQCFSMSKAPLLS